MRPDPLADPFLRSLLSRLQQWTSVGFAAPSSYHRMVLAGLLVLLLWLGMSLQQWDQVAPTQVAENPAERDRTTLTRPTAPVHPPDEIRGVWLTNVASSVLFSPWGIPRATRQLSDMHFNTVYPVVWNRGKTFYRSQVLKRLTGQAIDPLLALTHPSQEALTEMVQAGHRHHLRIMPWFEYGFMVPLHSRLAQQHPDWLTTRQDGSYLLQPDSSLTGGTPSNPSESARKPALLTQLLRSGAPRQLAWLNPLHPSVQALMIDLAEEVVSQYGVDGIQFDDHLSLPVEFGYDPYTVSLYRAEHQGQPPPSDPADTDWIRWRAGKLSKFMSILHARVKLACPTCVLSLSPNPAKFAYRFYLQDWLTWAHQGWIDELVVQVYRDQLPQFEGELGKASLQDVRDRMPVSIGILTGTWRRPIPFKQIQEQVTRSRDYHFSGVSFFYWETLWSYFTPESPQQRRQNFRALMNGKAPV